MSGLVASYVCAVASPRALLFTRPPSYYRKRFHFLLYPGWGPGLHVQSCNGERAMQLVRVEANELGIAVQDTLQVVGNDFSQAAQPEGTQVSEPGSEGCSSGTQRGTKRLRGHARHRASPAGGVPQNGGRQQEGNAGAGAAAPTSTLHGAAVEPINTIPTSMPTQDLSHTALSASAVSTILPAEGMDTKFTRSTKAHNPQEITATSMMATPRKRRRARRNHATSSQSTGPGAQHIVSLEPNTLPQRVPATDSPAVDSPAVNSPAVNSPAVNSPAVNSPAVNSPAVNSPAVNSPAVNSPAVNSPAVNSPAVNSPAVNSPAVISPAVNSPAVISPAVKSPAVISPAVNSPVGVVTNISFATVSSANATPEPQDSHRADAPHSGRSSKQHRKSTAKATSRTAAVASAEATTKVTSHEAVAKSNEAMAKFREAPHDLGKPRKQGGDARDKSGLLPSTSTRQLPESCIHVPAYRSSAATAQFDTGASNVASKSSLQSNTQSVPGFPGESTGETTVRHDSRLIGHLDASPDLHAAEHDEFGSMPSTPQRTGEGRKRRRRMKTGPSGPKTGATNASVSGLNARGSELDEDEWEEVIAARLQDLRNLRGGNATSVALTQDPDLPPPRQLRADQLNFWTALRRERAPGHPSLGGGQDTAIAGRRPVSGGVGRKAFDRRPRSAAWAVGERWLGMEERRAPEDQPGRQGKAKPQLQGPGNDGATAWQSAGRDQPAQQQQQQDCGKGLRRRSATLELQSNQLDDLPDSFMARDMLKEQGGDEWQLKEMTGIAGQQGRHSNLVTLSQQCNQLNRRGGPNCLDDSNQQRRSPGSLAQKADQEAVPEPASKGEHTSIQQWRQNQPPQQQQQQELQQQQRQWQQQRQPPHGQQQQQQPVMQQAGIGPAESSHGSMQAVPPMFQAVPNMGDADQDHKGVSLWCRQSGSWKNNANNREAAAMAEQQPSTHQSPAQQMPASQQQHHPSGLFLIDQQRLPAQDTMQFRSTSSQRRSRKSTWAVVAAAIAMGRRGIMQGTTIKNIIVTDDSAVPKNDGSLPSSLTAPTNFGPKARQGQQPAQEGADCPNQLAMHVTQVAPESAGGRDGGKKEELITLTRNGVGKVGVDVGVQRAPAPQNRWAVSRPEQHSDAAAAAEVSAVGAWMRIAATAVAATQSGSAAGRSSGDVRARRSSDSAAPSVIGAGSEAGSAQIPFQDKAQGQNQSQSLDMEHRRKGLTIRSLFVAPKSPAPPTSSTPVPDTSCCIPALNSSEVVAAADLPGTINTQLQTPSHENSKPNTRNRVHTQPQTQNCVMLQSQTQSDGSSQTNAQECGNSQPQTESGKTMQPKSDSQKIMGGSALPGLVERNSVVVTPTFTSCPPHAADASQQSVSADATQQKAVADSPMKTKQSRKQKQQQVMQQQQQQQQQPPMAQQVLLPKKQDLNLKQQQQIGSKQSERQQHQQQEPETSQQQQQPGSKQQGPTAKQKQQPAVTQQQQPAAMQQQQTESKVHTRPAAKQQQQPLAAIQLQQPMAIQQPQPAAQQQQQQVAPQAPGSKPLQQPAAIQQQQPEAQRQPEAKQQQQLEAKQQQQLEAKQQQQLEAKQQPEAKQWQQQPAATRRHQPLAYQQQQSAARQQPQPAAKQKQQPAAKQQQQPAAQQQQQQQPKGKRQQQPAAQQQQQASTKQQQQQQPELKLHTQAAPKQQQQPEATQQQHPLATKQPQPGAKQQHQQVAPHPLGSKPQQQPAAVQQQQPEAKPWQQQPASTQQHQPPAKQQPQSKQEQQQQPAAQQQPKGKQPQQPAAQQQLSGTKQRQQLAAQQQQPTSQPQQHKQTQQQPSSMQVPSPSPSKGQAPTRTKVKTGAQPIHPRKASSSPRRILRGKPSFALNKRLAGAKSLDDVVAVVSAHKWELDCCGVATALHRCAKFGSWRNNSELIVGSLEGPAGGALLAAGTDGRGSQHQRAVALAQELMPCLLQELDYMISQEIANTVWALSKLQCIPCVNVGQKLTEVLLADDARMLRSANCQEWANIAWGLAYLSQMDVDGAAGFRREAGHINALLDGLAEVVVTCPSNFQWNAQALANVMWACATLSYNHPAMISTLAAASVSVLHEMKAQEVANMLWAMAILDVRETRIVQLACQRAVSCVDGSESTQEVANVMWAAVVLGVTDVDFFRQVFHSANKILERCKTKELSSIWWCMNKLFSQDSNHLRPMLEEQGLLQDLYQVTQQRLTALPATFSSQSVSNILLGMAYITYPFSSTLEPLAPLLLSVVRERLQQGPQQHGFVVQELANILFGLQRLRILDLPLLHLVLDNILQHVSQLNAAEWSQVLITCAVLRLQRPDVVPAFSAALQASWVGFSSQEMCNVLWALAVMEHPDMRLYEQILYIMQHHSRLSDFTLVELNQLYQAHITLHDLNQPGVMPKWCGEDVMIKARSSWQQQTKSQVIVSRFQQAVFAAALELGLDPVLEVFTEDRLFSVDLVVRWRGCIVAVEVDGPVHYTRTTPYRPTGETVWRHHRLTRRFEGRFVTVRWHDLEKLDVDLCKRYLRGLLEELGQRRRKTGEGWGCGE